MLIREAVPSDIPRLHVIRMAVKENVLNNPLLVTEADYQKFIAAPNKGWVAEKDGVIIGFAIIDVETKNIWALFVDPAFEKQGAGRLLHDAMTDWYFSNHDDDLWLGTAPGTRAEAFYTKAGWKNCGMRANGEIRFEMKK
ncbi:MAG TPA: GNAT family N-acetyltransferase [Bacteroidia bacterium]|nr:GNAT family N-acetyltransferase [Bacteroidia bacterium]